MSVPKYNGSVINFVADNSFSTFSDINDTIIEINDKIAQVNNLSPEARDIKFVQG